MLLVPATHLDADTVPASLHPGIVGAPLDFPQRAWTARCLSRDVDPQRMHRGGRHRSIVPGAGDHNSNGSDAGADDVRDSHAGDPTRAHA